MRGKYLRAPFLFWIPVLTFHLGLNAGGVLTGDMPPGDHDEVNTALIDFGDQVNSVNHCPTKVELTEILLNVTLGWQTGVIERAEK